MNALSLVNATSNRKQKKISTQMVVHWTQMVVGEDAEAKAMVMKKIRRVSSSF